MIWSCGVGECRETKSLVSTIILSPIIIRPTTLSTPHNTLHRTGYQCTRCRARSTTHIRVPSYRRKSTSPRTSSKVVVREVSDKRRGCSLMRSTGDERPIPHTRSGGATLQHSRTRGVDGRIPRNGVKTLLEIVRRSELPFTDDGPDNGD